ncbi:sigma 54-interacting transcriptional regulator [Ligilactobacillus pobuzihii]|nr:sigma 54-interacting transcriptional regulator [Ligilactobacillus pobuzihii]GEN48882.1 transcriptional antiterminator [Ligilactobacillus pobuzihii]
MLQKEMQDYILKQSELFLNSFKSTDGLTTVKLAKHEQIDRTVASRYLNQQVKQGKMCKINIRPVIFIKTNFSEIRQEYKSITEFQKHYLRLMKNSAFDEVIGSNGGLKKQVDQIKAALLYPDNGLPAIIFGESGTGKGHLVKKSYQYAINAGILLKAAPFIMINCAQYADNPELLSSILFGYVKGAFTGADKRKNGVLQGADGGILFLDEVHRLNAEGQEKLFNYMDNGFFSPLGDNNEKIYSSARLIFATTERRENFLETFLRRVPIVINMPTLEKRGPTEKRRLIEMFFLKESKKIQKNIVVSEHVLTKLSQHRYAANVGEAENIIKNMVALSYSKKANSNSEVLITIKDLPTAFLSNEKATHNIPSNKKVVFDFRDKISVKNNQNRAASRQIMDAWKYMHQMDIHHVLERDKYEYIVNNLMNYLYFSVLESEDILFKYIISEVRDILQLMQYGEKFYNNNNLLYKISAYIYYLLEFSKEIPETLKLSSKVRSLFSKEYKFIQKIKPLMEKQFEIKITDLDIIWLSIMIAREDLPVDIIPAVIMAHGYATASSIADTCNGILKYPVYQSIDMLPSASSEEMVNSLRNIIGELSPTNGLVILIDMGSLTQTIDKIKRFFSYPVLVVNKVSTPVALEVGNYLQQHIELRRINQLIGNTRVESTFHKPLKNTRNVIVTTCMTGMGTAEQIGNLLRESFSGIIDVEVLPFEFYRVNEDINKIVTDGANVICIVGIDDPQVEGIPYLGLEDIISGEKIDDLKKILLNVATAENVNVAEHKMVKNFSLSRVMGSLTILSPEKVLSVIEGFLNNTAQELGESISNKNQIALYVHIASMIERLVRNQGIKQYQGDNSLIVKDDVYSVLKKKLSVIEDEFLISVTDAEIAYIRDLITK